MMEGCERRMQINTALTPWQSSAPSEMGEWAKAHYSHGHSLTKDVFEFYVFFRALRCPPASLFRHSIKSKQEAPRLRRESKVKTSQQHVLVLWAVLEAWI